MESFLGDILDDIGLPFFVNKFTEVKDRVGELFVLFPTEVALLVIIIHGTDPSCFIIVLDGVHDVYELLNVKLYIKSNYGIMYHHHQRNWRHLILYLRILLLLVFPEYPGISHLDEV